MAGLGSIAFLACLTAVSVYGHSCPPLATCDLSQCDAPLDCPGGIVKESCGCCDVCARVLHQTCGGLHGFTGMCDLGLTCVVASDGQPLRGDEEGVCMVSGPELQCASPKKFTSCTLVNDHCLCREISSCLEPLVQYKSRQDCYRAVATKILKESQANCSRASHVPCDFILPSCPADSVPRAGELLPGECCPKQGTCVCDPLSCELHVCTPNYDRMLTRKATGEPGRCCDVYVCVYAGTNCSTVTCPPHEIACPADSFQLPSVLDADECCSRPQGCACLPTSCAEARCPEGHRLKIIQVGDGSPGRCCTTFHCIKPGEHTCLYEGEEYIEGDTWKAGNCTSCSCKGNVTFCTSEHCQYPTYCGRMQVPEGKCCPICTGCVSGSGAIFANGETWQQDDCTTCSCAEGKVQCQAELCSVQCHNPRRIPGRCCPHCDGPSVIVSPPECPTLTNCMQTCSNGYQKDSKGCDICQCRLDGCRLNCDLGYVIDEHGAPVCKCRCPSLDDCDKRCIHGFKLDSNSCKVCRCAKCRSLTCAKKCLYGHVRNDRGCRTCRCLNKEIETTDAEYYNVTTEAIQTTRSTLPTDFPFLSTCATSNALRDEGEMWHDGCRNCYCHAGKEMCGLITCPTLGCENSIIFPGDCCPKCVADDAVLPSVNVTVCQSVDRTYRVEGETWDLDSRTHCICHNGLVLCSMDECPPAACSSPAYGEGYFCPVCPEVEDVGSKSNSRCVSESQTRTYEDGATWRVDACHSCQCLNGQIKCFSDKCPKLNCSTPVLLKGQCCSICLYAEKPAPVCIHGEIRYDSGEMWSVNDCTQCICLNGRTECKEIVCSMSCAKPLPKLPGQCCPECPIVSPNLTTHGRNKTLQSDIETTEPSGDSWQTIILIIVAVCSSLVAFGLVLYLLMRKRRRTNRHDVITNNVDQMTESKYSFLKDNRNNAGELKKTCNDSLCSNNNKIDPHATP